MIDGVSAWLLGEPKNIHWWLVSIKIWFQLDSLILRIRLNIVNGSMNIIRYINTNRGIIILRFSTPTTISLLWHRQPSKWKFVLLNCISFLKQKLKKHMMTIIQLLNSKGYLTVWKMFRLLGNSSSKYLVEFCDALRLLKLSILKAFTKA